MVSPSSDSNGNEAIPIPQRQPGGDDKPSDPCIDYFPTAYLPQSSTIPPSVYPNTSLEPSIQASHGPHQPPTVFSSGSAMSSGINTAPGPMQQSTQKFDTLHGPNNGEMAVNDKRFEVEGPSMDYGRQFDAVPPVHHSITNSNSNISIPEPSRAAEDVEPDKGTFTINFVSPPSTADGSAVNSSDDVIGKSKRRGKGKVRPCDNCRRRKTKCVMDPNMAGCFQCMQRKIKCVFSDPAKRNSKEEQPASGKKLKTSDSDNTFQQRDGKRPAEPVTDYSKLQNSSLLKKTLSLQYPRSSFYVGPTSVYDLKVLNSSVFEGVDQVKLSSTFSLRKVGPDAIFALRDDYSDRLYRQSMGELDVVEKTVAPFGPALIDLFFRIVHPSFPVLHKRVFLEKYSRTYREFSAPLLAAVYALGINWWDYDPVLSTHPKPDTEILRKIAMKTYADVIERPKLSAVQAGLLLLQCFPGDNKAWILSCQVVALAEELGLGKECSSWRLPKWERGLRRRLAWAVWLQDKWLSLIVSRPSHISCKDNWLVGEVVEEDFPEKPGTELDNNKEGSVDIENGRLLFKYMVSLSHILSDILDNLFSMKALVEVSDIQKVLAVAKPLQFRLRDFYHNLPPILRMENIKSRKLCSNGYLHLAYFATEITLHRRIITVISDTELKIWTAEKAGNGKCNLSPIPKELTELCRNAAKTRLLAAIDFVRNLKPEHVQSFWHSSSTANFALIGSFAVLLYVTSKKRVLSGGTKNSGSPEGKGEENKLVKDEFEKDEVNREGKELNDDQIKTEEKAEYYFYEDTEESNFYRDQILNYRWILKVSSKGFVQLAMALEKLEQILVHIPGLNPNLQTKRMTHLSAYSGESSDANTASDAMNAQYLPTYSQEELYSEVENLSPIRVEDRSDKFELQGNATESEASKGKENSPLLATENFTNSPQ